MRRNKRTLVAAVAVGALVLAGSAAFTNSHVDSAERRTRPVAYGSQNVSSATVTAISYTLDGNNPTTVHGRCTFTTTGDTTGFDGAGRLQRQRDDDT